MSAVRHTYEGAGPHAGRSWGFILRPVASLREGYDGWAEDEDREGEREEIGRDNKEGRKEKWEGKKVDIRSISTSISHLLLHYGFVEWAKDEDNEGERKKKKQRKECIKTKRESERN